MLLSGLINYGEIFKQINPLILGGINSTRSFKTLGVENDGLIEEVSTWQLLFV